VDAIPYGRGDAYTFANALLAYAETSARQVPSLSFRLPRFDLTISSDSGDYLELCRRALVDDSRFADGERLAVSVLDYETHSDMPRGIWSGAEFGLSLFKEGLEGSGFEASLNSDYHLLQFYKVAARSGVEALRRPGQYPPWIASFPLRNFLHWAYVASGWRVIHAGTLAIDGKGVLLAGRGGAGKSGTVLAGVVNGLDSAGDDYVVVELDDRAITAHPIMKLMKQDACGLERLSIDPHERALGAPNWQQKYEFDFECLERGKRARRIEILGILLPRIAGSSQTTITSARASAAMTALAPNNLVQLPDSWRGGLSIAAHLVRRLPAFEVQLSSNPAEIAESVRSLIHRLQ